jgi:hypothetical protein
MMGIIKDIFNEVAKESSEVRISEGVSAYIFSPAVFGFLHAA